MVKLPPGAVFDGHNDALTRSSSNDEAWTFLDRSRRGHLDLPRAREGGFVGGFFAIFPSIEPGTWSPRGANYHREGDGFRVDLCPPADETFTYEFSRRMWERLDRTVEASNGDFRLIRTVEGLDGAIEDGALAAIAHFEGAEPLGDDMRRFDEWYERGLRSVGLVWSRANTYAQGVPFAWPASPDIGPGLTDPGFELVRTCDARGVVVDLAHLNEKGFWDVAKTTSRPLVVTHTAVWELAQKPRNLTDRQIDAVAESDGVIGITFFNGDLAPNPNPGSDASIDDIVGHVRYVADRVGPEHVALGSDFDGAPIPSELRDVAGLPKLVDALRAAGFDDDALAFVTHDNWLRILRATLPD